MACGGAQVRDARDLVPLLPPMPPLPARLVQRPPGDGAPKSIVR
ncbi:hypothetical protein [Nonomuraea sp. NPDC049480]